MGAIREHIADTVFNVMRGLVIDAAADLVTDNNSDDYNQALVDMSLRMLGLGPEERSSMAYLIGLRNERLAALFNQPTRPDLPDTRRS